MDKRLDRIRKKLSIKQAKLKKPESTYHNKRIGKLKQKADILNNKKETKDLRKALGVRRAEKLIEKD